MKISLVFIICALYFSLGYFGGGYIMLTEPSKYFLSYLMMMILLPIGFLFFKLWKSKEVKQ